MRAGWLTRAKALTCTVRLEDAVVASMVNAASFMSLPASATAWSRMPNQASRGSGEPEPAAAEDSIPERADSLLGSAPGKAQPILDPAGPAWCPVRRPVVTVARLWARLLEEPATT